MFEFPCIVPCPNCGKSVDAHAVYNHFMSPSCCTEECYECGCEFKVNAPAIEIDGIDCDLEIIKK